MSAGSNIRHWIIDELTGAEERIVGYDDFVDVSNSLCRTSTMPSTEWWSTARRELDKIKWQDELAKWKQRATYIGQWIDDENDFASVRPVTKTRKYDRDQYAAWLDRYLYGDWMDILNANLEAELEPISFDDAMGFGGADGNTDDNN